MSTFCMKPILTLHLQNAYITQTGMFFHAKIISASAFYSRKHYCTMSNVQSKRQHGAIHAI